MKYFTSDLHFHHRNICKFTDRSLFTTTAEHDQWGLICVTWVYIQSVQIVKSTMSKPIAKSLRRKGRHEINVH